ncbi:Uncharacterised protein [Mycobacterium tuberculosis]|nr:Uncharacterised protein [Mycobacterium tuberculosis]
MPPMIECVVDTGYPIRLANSSQSAAADSADSMMFMKSRGLTDTPDRSTMPLRMVSVTSPPAITAPLTSKIAATRSACFMVNVPAPTLVPNELATSLPPTLKAMNMPTTVASTRMTLFAPDPA